MANLLSALHGTMAVYTMNNVQLTAALLAGVVTVVLILKRRSRRQRAQSPSNH